MEKILEIEEEIDGRLSKAEKQGASRLEDLRAARIKFFDDVRNSAVKRGKKIVKEKIMAARAEINAMKQDEAQAIAIVHNQAKKRRSEGTGRAIELFKEWLEI